MTTVRITDAGGGKPSFVQWDVDRVVIVSGVTSQPMLHFANAELKRAIVVPTEETSTGSGKWKADVPNFILQFPLPIVISVFLQPEGGEGQTVATVPFGVRAKPKPQDYTYEENIGYINWVNLTAEIQRMLDDGELKGDPGPAGDPPAVDTEITYYGNKVTFTGSNGPKTINVLDGMTATVKAALLDLLEHVAYIDGNGQTYYDALDAALNPVLGVDYITVVFDPGTAVIYNTDELASIKPYITCTAHYEDGTSAIVDTYTLSGTLTTGTSAVTATYGGKSSIFTVNVVEWLVSITAVFTPGSNVIYDSDGIDALEQYLAVTANFADTTTATVTDYTLSGTLAPGTSTITVSYSGKTTTFDVTVYAGYRYPGVLEKITGSLGAEPSTQTGMIFYSNNPYRRVFFLADGDSPKVYKNDDPKGFLDYYPIPIPSAATKMTVSVSPSTQYVAAGLWSLSNDVYTRDVDSGWVNETYTVQFTAGQYGYTAVSTKYDSAGQSYPTEPASITVTFE